MELLDNYQELLFFIGLGLAGSIAHVLKKLKGLEKQEGFILSDWIKHNIFGVIYGLFVVAPSIVGAYEMGQLNAMTAVLIGYTGDSMMAEGRKKYLKKLNKPS